jgi:hypothetical protein
VRYLHDWNTCEGVLGHEMYNAHFNSKTNCDDVTCACSLCGMLEVDILRTKRACTGDNRSEEMQRLYPHAPKKVVLEDMRRRRVIQ